MPNAPVHWYAGGLKAILNEKLFDVDSDSLKFALMKTSYTPDQNAHAHVSDLVTGSNECTGGGYARQTLTSVVISVASLVVSIDFDDVAFGTLTLTTAGTGPRWGVVFDDTPATAATKPLVAYWDFGAEQLPNAQSFSVIPPAGGPLKLTAS